MGSREIDDGKLNVPLWMNVPKRMNDHPVSKADASHKKKWNIPLWLNVALNEWMQSAAVCFSRLQCAAVCCSVLQCVAVNVPQWLNVALSEWMLPRESMMPKQIPLCENNILPREWMFLTRTKVPHFQWHMPRLGFRLSHGLLSFMWVWVVSFRVQSVGFSVLTGWGVRFKV